MLHTEGQGTETGGGDFTVSGGRALVKVTLGAGNYRVTACGRPSCWCSKVLPRINGFLH